MSLACLAPAGLPTALADDVPPSGYPTWTDVQAAKANVDATKAETDKIASLLTTVETTATDASARAVAAGAASARAAQAVKDQEQVVAVLDQEAAKRAGERDAAQRAAGQLAADSYMGGSPTGPLETLSVLGEQDGLGRLQTLQVLGDQAAQALTDYRVATNAAVAAEDKSKAAKDALADLSATAAQQLSEAQAAQKQAQDIVAQTQQHEGTLLAQLADLKGTSASVEQGYRDGQAAQAAYEAAQEAKRKAAEEAAAQAAAQQAAALRAQQAAQEQATEQRAQALAQQQAQALAQQRAQQSPQQQGAASGAAQAAPAAPAPAPARVPVPVAIPVYVAPPAVVSPGVGVVNDPAGAQAYASSQLRSFGWGSGEYGCLVKLWNQESSWMTDATNPSSGAYGIAQALPPSKYSTAGSDWLTNYRTQINWGLGYIANRYGSPCNAWSHEVSSNWY